MRRKITRELLRDEPPRSKAFDIADTELKGFIARITPSGVKSYGIRYTSQAGKQMRYSLKMTFPSTSPSEAREAARILLGRIAVGEDPAAEKKAKKAGKLTLVGFLNGDYGDHLRSKTKTAEATILRLKKVFAQFSDTPLEEIDAITIERWRSARIRAGIAAATVNRDIGALRPVFSRAIDWQLLTEHPLKQIKPLKSNSDPIVRYLTEAEEERLRTALERREQRYRDERQRANAWRTARRQELLPEYPETGYVDYLMPAVLLSLNTGIRQGELIALEWQNVHLESHARLFIPGRQSKSGRGRHIPLNDEAKAVLMRWKAQQVHGRLVFPSREGSELVEVKTAWRTLLRDAEVTAFRWHDMRHHFASRLVMVGVDLNTVRELLGHADLQMTLRYAHLAPEHKLSAVQKLVRRRQMTDAVPSEQDTVDERPDPPASTILS
ncbi:site-specific integrase [Noviherbaspirillum sp.]|uniref:site-specific integrase n=1 Tax=Noviherbaspirillum sp. TaxID=1926288 RepID=UPI002D5642AD|nr:site-specific integrase [Noviherbaspirillum sp.]HZW20243.1 site-specific integrase [Noviherbaspirillum sp.]